MVLIKLLLSFVFPFLIVSSRVPYSSAPARRWSFLKGIDASSAVAPNASSAAAPNPSSTVAPNNSSTGNTSAINDTARVTPGTGSSNETATPVSSSGEPGPTDTTTCHSPGGKDVNFVDRECWFAAKVMAENGTSISQCGHCVLGLYDAEKKNTFKPPGPLDPSIIQEQTLKLLRQCKDRTVQKISKRDPPAFPADQQGTNVQLLIGYKSEEKSCPGL